MYQHQRIMRTTINIDDDVLRAAKDIAAARGQPLGKVLSDLVRRALTQPAPSLEEGQADYEAGPKFDVFHGIHSFPSRDGPRVTVETVQSLVEAEDDGAVAFARGDDVFGRGDKAEDD